MVDVSTSDQLYITNLGSLRAEYAPGAYWTSSDTDIFTLASSASDISNTLISQNTGRATLTLTRGSVVAKNIAVLVYSRRMVGEVTPSVPTPIVWGGQSEALHAIVATGTHVGMLGWETDHGKMDACYTVFKEDTTRVRATNSGAFEEPFGLNIYRTTGVSIQHNHSTGYIVPDSFDFSVTSIDISSGSNTSAMKVAVVESGKLHNQSLMTNYLTVATVSNNLIYGGDITYNDEDEQFEYTVHRRESSGANSTGKYDTTLSVFGVTRGTRVNIRPSIPITKLDFSTGLAASGIYNKSQAYTIDLSFTPANPTNKQVTWSLSPNDSYAELTSTGRTSCVLNTRNGYGYYTLTATANDNANTPATVSTDINVAAGAQLTNLQVSISGQPTNVFEGATYMYLVSYKPQNVLIPDTDDLVVESTLDISVGSIVETQYGFIVPVTFLNTGKHQLTFTLTDATNTVMTAKDTRTVKAFTVSKITFSAPSYNVYKDTDPLPVKAILYPYPKPDSTSEFGAVSWTVGSKCRFDETNDDTNVAYVETSGSQADGTAVLTATYGEVSASVTLNTFAHAAPNRLRIEGNSTLPFQNAIGTKMTARITPSYPWISLGDISWSVTAPLTIISRGMDENHNPIATIGATDASGVGSVICKVMRPNSLTVVDISASKAVTSKQVLVTDVSVSAIDSSLTIDVGSVRSITMTAAGGVHPSEHVNIDPITNATLSVYNKTIYIGGRTPGHDNLIISDLDGEIFADISVNVRQVVQSVTLSAAKTMVVGTGLMVGTIVLPINANIRTLSWVSSDANIISVDQYGNVRANAPGRATITATATDGSLVSGSVTIRTTTTS